jgi:signal-transduction protein with cAMP-binding, CBS, and nucleotidyltransferase domain
VRSRRARGRWVVARDLHGGEPGATGRTVLSTTGGPARPPNRKDVTTVGTGIAPSRDRDAGPAPETRVDELMRPATSTVERDAHLAAAAYLMKHRGDTALVVVTDDADRTPVAIVTDADISQAVADGRAPERTRITDLALGPPITVQTGTSAGDAARLMLSRGIQHLPVVDGERLVGLVDMSDVCRAFLSTS